MPKPDQDQLNLLEQQRTELEGRQLFQSDRDFRFQQARVGEQSERLGGVIHFVPVSTERSPQGPFQSARVDPLDGDVLDPQFIENPMNLDLDDPDNFDQRLKNVDCILQHEPSKQLLKKFGIDEEREIVFWVPFTIFKTAGIVTEKRFRGADIGDLIVWDGTWYMAQNVHRDHYFGQRDVSFFVACFCNRYRQNLNPIHDTADDCPEDFD